MSDTQNGIRGSLEPEKKCSVPDIQNSSQPRILLKFSEENNEPMWALFWCHATYLIGLKTLSSPVLTAEEGATICLLKTKPEV